MQNRLKKQVATNEEESVKDSPYRMGNWTVTMLKEELRVRQLPITGKKSELIDRLENSPTKTTSAPNIARKSASSPSKGSPLKGLSESLQVKLLEKKSESPLKKTAASALYTSSFSSVSSLNSPSSRGRSRSSSPAGMMTRSRSTSLSRGTFLTWTRSPTTVLINFTMAQVDTLKSNAILFSALAFLFVAFGSILTYNSKYQAIFLEQFARVQPVLQVFLEGFLSNLGLASSEFSYYVSKASRFMYDCSSGNIERNSATGRLRCSAAVLTKTSGGLPGRLFWLTREQFIAWSLGSIVASTVVYFITKKCRTALPITNKTLRNILNLSARFSFFIAAFSPFEVVGLISGFSGFENGKFLALLASKAFIAIPLQFAVRILAAKNQNEINSRIEKLPLSFKSIIGFFTDSIYILKSRQFINCALYTLLCAAAVQVIANTRVYKNLRVKRN